MSSGGDSAILTQVIKTGCIGLLPGLIDTAIGQKDAHGFTALMYNAILYMNLLNPTLLKEAGEVSAEGKTALMYALEHNNSDVASALIDAEAFIPDSSGTPPIIYAIKSCCEPLALRLWDALEAVGTAPNDIVTADARTIDMWAAECDMLAILKRCRQKDDIHYSAYCDAHGRTALMYAARAGSASCVEELRFSLPLARDSDGLTALMHAAGQGHANVVRILAKDYSASEGATKCLAELPETNDHLFLGKQDNLGRTALHHAIFSGTAECVRLLLCERRIRDSCSQSGGLYICRSGMLQIYQRLLTFSEHYRPIDLCCIVTADQVMQEIHRHFLDKDSTFATAVHHLAETLFSIIIDCEVSLDQIESTFDSLPVCTNMLCCSCNINLATHILYPCHHLCMCTSCVPRVGGFCPICLRSIFHTVSILLEGE